MTYRHNMKLSLLFSKSSCKGTTTTTTRMAAASSLSCSSSIIITWLIVVAYCSLMTHAAFTASSLSLYTAQRFYHPFSFQPLSFSSSSSQSSLLSFRHIKRITTCRLLVALDATTKSLQDQSDESSSANNNNSNDSLVQPPSSSSSSSFTSAQTGLRRRNQQWSRNDNDDDDELSLSVSVNNSSTTNTVNHHDINITNSNKVPSYRKLLIFASTTLCIWLSEPLLSLVDTTVIAWTLHGQTSCIMQLAAMGPATTLLDLLLYMMYFLATSTTNLISQGIAEQHWRQLQQTSSNLLAVAAVLGLVVTVVMYSPCGIILLRLMAGGGGASATAATATPELIHYAVAYSRIRASVAPLAIMGMVAQSFCLATLNTAAPVMAVLVASIINIFGDLLLSHWGVIGVAIATAMASTVSTVLLLVAVQTKLCEWRLNEVEQFHQEQQQQQQQQALEMQQQQQVDQDDDVINSNNLDMTTTPPTQVLEPPPRIPFLSLPSSMSLLQLATISGPLAINMWCKMIAYSSFTLRTAALLDVTPAIMAAHNVLMRLFYFFACFADSIGMSAQAFVPTSLYPHVDSSALRQTLQRLTRVALVTAIVIGFGSMGLLNTLGHLLARDVDMLQMMQNQSIWLGLALFLHPLVVLSEGTVIAMRDFKNLMITYACTIVLHIIILYKTTTTFSGVWKAMVAFQLIRLVNFRLWRTWRSKIHLTSSTTTTLSKENATTAAAAAVAGE